MMTLFPSSQLIAAQPTAMDFAGHIDLEVPQSAGFALLGVTPDKVIEPQSGRDFGAALLQGLDASGNFQSGFALETRPFLWGQPAYIAEPTTRDRILSGFKISFATTKGLDDEDKANRYGLGINWTYQFNDPLFNKDYVKCIKAANDTIPVIPPADTSALKNKLIEASLACQEEYISWTSTALSVGVAGNKAKEKETNLNDSGAGIWITGSLALSKDAEIVGHLRRVNNQLSVVKGVLTEADVSLIASRFRYGNDSIRGIIEASWNEEALKGKDNDYTLASIGAEFKVMKGTWFRVAYGKTFGSTEDDEEFFSGQFRFGFGDEPLSKFGGK